MKKPVLIFILFELEVLLVAGEVILLLCLLSLVLASLASLDYYVPPGLVLPVEPI